MRKRGFRKALFVTDKDLIRFGVAEKIEQVLRKADIPTNIPSDLKGQPHHRQRAERRGGIQTAGADFIIALGGGSSIDTAKAVGIIVNNPGSPTCVRSRVRPPHATVPSPLRHPHHGGHRRRGYDKLRHHRRAGPQEDGLRRSQRHPDVRGDRLRADDVDAPGADGRHGHGRPDAYAIESYITPGHGPQRHVRDEGHRTHRPPPERTPSTRHRQDAREGMAEAQYIAGMGFSNVGLGIVHSMAHPLGAFYDTPTALANALLCCPYVMEYNAESPSRPKITST